MGHQIIRADENGSLVVPAVLVGGVHPGTIYTVEPHGDVVILRRENPQQEDWWSSTSPADRVAWLEEWIASLPSSPALPREAARRDAMYE